MSELLGYARVSTRDQNPDLQLDALRAAGCSRIFTDKASGALDARPELDRLIDQLRPGDTVVVWKLDRLGRSLRHLIDVVNDLKAREVQFRSLREGFDTSTAAGWMLFQVMGALAEFERALILERTRAGLDAARARGKKGGRKAVMTPQKLTIARQMYDAQEHTVEDIAKTLGVSRATIHRHLKEQAS